MEKKSFKSPIIVASFGVVCLIAAMIMSINVGDPEFKWLAADGGKVGPIVTKDKNEIRHIELMQSLPLMKWSSVNVDVLDEHGNYLFAFGDEFWHESGRDSEGRWEESKSTYSVSVTFLQPGKYFLDISSESNVPKGQLPGIGVEVTRELGSTIAFIWLGIGSLLIAGLWTWLKTNN